MRLLYDSWGDGLTSGIPSNPGKKGALFYCFSLHSCISVLAPSFCGTLGVPMVKPSPKIIWWHILAKKLPFLSMWYWTHASLEPYCCHPLGKCISTCLNLFYLFFHCWILLKSEVYGCTGEAPHTYALLQLDTKGIVIRLRTYYVEVL